MAALRPLRPAVAGFGQGDVLNDLPRPDVALAGIRRDFAQTGIRGCGKSRSRP